MIVTVNAIMSGVFVGFSLGLLGGGGSILATPLLLYSVGVANPHVAIGTGALAVSVSAYLNFIGHARAGNVCWLSAIVFALVGSVGALLGSTLGKAVDGTRLLILFGLVMVVVGGLMLRPRRATDELDRATTRGRHIISGLVAFAVGAASGFFGIGGGFLIVPGLILATGMPTINAIGSSLLAVGSFALATALNYAQSGFVDWVIAVNFIGGGILGGVMGLLLAGRMALHKDMLNRLFAGVIFVVAIYVIWRSWNDLPS
jgi:uncharacterized membrane protein YfcA